MTPLCNSLQDPRDLCAYLSGVNPFSTSLCRIRTWADELNEAHPLLSTTATGTLPVPATENAQTILLGCGSATTNYFGLLSSD